MPESAIIVRAPEAEPLVGRLRELYDPSAKRGVPAHITLVYPFVAPDQITESIVARVRRFAAATPAFAYRLASTGRFTETLYLAPDPAQPFVDLVNGLTQHFSGYKPYGGQFDSFVPHLTVAHGTGLPISELDAELCSHPLLRAGISASCHTLVLIENSSGSWRERNAFSLAAGAE